MGTGKTSNNIPLDDFWKYDSLSDSWTLVSHMPNPRHSAVALTINNKAYVGFGIQGNLEPDLYDFYEFDPDYPLK
jgi:N-acetylneuraminic acid mutarotase